MKSLRTRQCEEEWMDRPDADPVQLERSLGYLRMINRLLRYTRTTIAHLERFSQRWNPGERISIIDFATGSADVPRAILRWAARRGHDVRVVGIDLHPETSRFALAEGTQPGLSIVRADAMALPFEAGSFDYAITGLFLHHLSEDQAVSVLRAMDRVSRRGMVVGDLIRNRRAYAWINVLTLWANPMVRHDACVSVAQAFTRAEAEALRVRAGLRYLRYSRHVAHRFTLAGEKV
jgi:ubiquinone/menaquinone biosynthesis C-methylase UbiE